MKLQNIFSFRKKDVEPTHAQQMVSMLASESEQPEASYRYKPYPVYHENWDGERSFGELGFPIDYTPDFRNLAIRSWQSFYESDITQMIIKNYLLWVVGKGLTLTSEPITKYIKKYDATFNRDQFTDEIEDLWQIYANSKRASYSEMQNLHQLAFNAQLNSIVGGDVLVVMRYDGNIPSIQLIDGLHVMNPTSGNYYAEAKAKGNLIKNGVEVSAKGKHVAFYVKDKDNKFERLAANHSKTGRPLAWLVYGFKYRIDDTRGMPLFAVVLEELKKIGRYKDAAVSSAEENAKIAYTIEHGDNSSGANPFTNTIKQAMASGQGTVPETGQYTADPLATKIAITTNKQVFNLEPGATLKSHKSENELSFKDFFSTNFDIICATMGVAPEVVLNKYNSNYSASRMASKTSEFKYKTDRYEFANAFYKPIYSFWLDTRVYLGKINTPGYTTALVKNDFDMLEAFKTCEFIGANMPHVDPLKEIKAEREKLGNSLIPLTTHERATRNSGDGDWYQNIENFRQEMNIAGDYAYEKTEKNGKTGTAENGEG